MSRVLTGAIQENCENKYRPCPPGAYSLDKTERCIDRWEVEGRGAEVETRHGKGERKKPCDEEQVDMLWSQHSVAMAGRVGVGVPAGRWQARVRRGRAPVPCRAAACSMHQVLPDLISQVAAGPSADPAAVAITEGTAGATGPGAPTAPADEPPDAHKQAGQHEQRAQHCTDDHSYALGVWGEK